MLEFELFLASRLRSGQKEKKGFGLCMFLIPWQSLPEREKVALLITTRGGESAQTLVQTHESCESQSTPGGWRIAAALLILAWFRVVPFDTQ